MAQLGPARPPARQGIALPGADPAGDSAQGQEVKRLRAQLEKVATSPRRLALVLRVPTSDVIVAAAGGEIEAEFGRQKGRVLFVADVKCRPDEKLAAEYPDRHGYRYLSSSGRWPGGSSSRWRKWNGAKRSAIAIRANHILILRTMIESAADVSLLL